jgi:hypothetical protein
MGNLTYLINPLSHNGGKWIVTIEYRVSPEIREKKIDKCSNFVFCYCKDLTSFKKI